MERPREHVPVLAQIQNVTIYGTFTWYEVVYYDGNWRSYAGSTTFDDGEIVLRWTYITEQLFQ